MRTTEDQEAAELAFHALFERSVVLVLYRKPKRNPKTSLTLTVSSCSPWIAQLADSSSEKSPVHQLWDWFHSWALCQKRGLLESVRTLTSLQTSILCQDTKQRAWLSWSGLVAVHDPSQLYRCMVQEPLRQWLRSPLGLVQREMSVLEAVDTITLATRCRLRGLSSLDLLFYKRLPRRWPETTGSVSGGEQVVFVTAYCTALSFPSYFLLPNSWFVSEKPTPFLTSVNRIWGWTRGQLNTATSHGTSVG